jgi:hypothetical protein
MPSAKTNPGDPLSTTRNGDALASGETLENVARFAADTGADPKYYERDLIDALIAVQALVRNNPVTALIIAAGVGFVAGRSVSRIKSKHPHSEIPRGRSASLPGR